MLPGLKLPKVKRFSDLDFVLHLIHTNRAFSQEKLKPIHIYFSTKFSKAYRQYLKLSYDIMISSDSGKASRYERHQKFIASMKEITIWKTTTSNDEAINLLLKKTS